ncbi:MAG: MFS transporter [Gaiellales bacterium]|nr:MFS transporter [Gaiellales bacterium]
MLTLTAMCFSLFMVGVDTTAVNLALAEIQRALSAGLSELQWVVDSFLLVVASAMLTGGALGDRYGHKRLFLVGMALFTGGSLVGALAPSVALVIAGRALQGLGAATMMPATLAVLTDTFTEPRERAKAIGIWAGVSGTALAVGPLLGGVLVDAFSWQAIFWINVPIGLVALVVAGRCVPGSKGLRRRPLDLPGQIMAIAGLGTLTYGIIEAANRGWGDPLILTVLAVAAALLVMFVLWEARTRHPMLELAFFRNRTFSGCNLAGVLMYFGFFAMLFFLGVFMQNAQGYTATQAGLLQFPLTLAIAATGMVSGAVVARFGARPPVLVGLLLQAVFMLALSGLTADASYTAYWWMLALLGVGHGLVMSPLTTAIMSTVPGARAGIASATAMTFRQLGTALGVAVIGSIVARDYISRLEVSLQALPLDATQTSQILAGALTAPGAVAEVPAGVDAAALRSQVAEAFAGSFGLGLGIGGCAILLAFLGGLFLIRHRALDKHQETGGTEATVEAVEAGRVAG